MPATAEECRKYRRRLRNRARTAYGNRCQVCGDKVKLEFAHIKPTGLRGASRGLTKRYLDVLKHPNCYRLLCQKHHRALGRDWEQFTWDDIPY